MLSLRASEFSHQYQLVNVGAVSHVESSSGINAEDSQLRPLLPHDGVQKSDALNIDRDETGPGGDHRSGVLISRSGRSAGFADVDPLLEGEAVLGSRAAVVASRWWCWQGGLVAGLVRACLPFK